MFFFFSSPVHAQSEICTLQHTYTYTNTNTYKHKHAYTYTLDRYSRHVNRQGGLQGMGVRCKARLRTLSAAEHVIELSHVHLSGVNGPFLQALQPRSGVTAALTSAGDRGLTRETRLRPPQRSAASCSPSGAQEAGGAGGGWKGAGGPSAPADTSSPGS